MNERAMLCSNQQFFDLSNGQVQNHLHPEPWIVLGSTSSFSQSHVNQVVPPSGSLSSFDLHHLPEHVVRPAFYGMTQYNQPNYPVTSQHNFNMHMEPSSSARAFPVPLNHGIVDHLPSSNNYGANAISHSEHGSSNYFPECSRELCKRKQTEGNQGNSQQFGVFAGPSSSSAAPMENGHYEPGEASLPLTDHRGNGPHMDSGMEHTYNNYSLQGIHGAQSFQPSSCTWVLDQQSIRSTGGLLWNGPPMPPYFQGNNVHGGSSEMGHGGLPSYPERSNNQVSANFLQSSPPVIQQHHNFHPSHYMQAGVRGYGVTCYPPLLAPPNRVPPIENLQYDVLSVSQEAAEPVNRPTGIRIYRSQGRSLGPDGASRRHDLPRLRTLTADRVAILEFPNFYDMEYDVESFIDHHSDMRLDVDNMTYEDLLALGEQIGTVNTGLSEEDIRCHLKTRRYKSTATFNLEELPCSDQNDESCIICQDEYEHNAKLGTLDCGHEYHVNCLKKWLLLKNVCPICKSAALAVKK